MSGAYVDAAGVSFKTVNGIDCVVVQVGKTFLGADRRPRHTVTLRTLAKTFRLNADQVVGALLAETGPFKANHAALRGIHMRNVAASELSGDIAKEEAERGKVFTDAELDARYAAFTDGRSYEDRRADLFRRALLFNDGKPVETWKYVTKNLWLDWKVPPEVTVLLPRSTHGFQDLVPGLSGRRKKKHAVAPDPPSQELLQKVEQAWNEVMDALLGGALGGGILADARELANALADRWALTKRTVRDVVVLELLDQMLTAMTHGKNSKGPAGNKAVEKDLQPALRSLIDGAYQALLFDPHRVDVNAGTVEGLTNRLLGDPGSPVKGKLNDPGLLANVELVVEHWELAKPEDWLLLYDALGFVARALLLTNAGSRFYEEHLEALIHEWVVDYRDQGVLGALTDQWEDAVTATNQGLPTKHKTEQSVFGILGTLGSAYGSATKGVELMKLIDFGAAILKLTQPHVLARLRREGGAQRGTLRSVVAISRAMFGLSKLPPYKAREHLLGLAGIELKLNVRWDAVAGGLQGFGMLAGMLQVWAAVKEDDFLLTTENWLKLLGGVGATAEPLGMLMRMNARMMRSGLLRGGAKVLSSPGLIAVTSLVGVVVGAFAIRKASKDEDDLALLSGVLSTTGALATFGGTVLAIGCATTGTGAGAPLGLWLIAAGIILTGVSLAIDIGKWALSAGTANVWRLCIKAFEEGQAYSPQVVHNAEVKGVLKIAKQVFDDVPFWELDPTDDDFPPGFFVQQGFPPKLIGLMYDIDPDDMRSPKFTPGDVVHMKYDSAWDLGHRTFDHLAVWKTTAGLSDKNKRWFVMDLVRLEEAKEGDPVEESQWSYFIGPANGQGVDLAEIPEFCLSEV